MGKTRLALELCRTMATRGWVSGFYRPTGDQAVANLAALPAPRLVVVDYAETDPDGALALITALADQLPTRSTRVRIVLVIRRGEPVAMFGRRQTRAALLVESAKVLTVGHGRMASNSHSAGTQFGLEERTRLYDSAVEAFNSSGVQRPNLAEDVYATPLFVLLAAVLTDKGLGDGGVGLSRADILDRVLMREEETHWNDSPEQSSDVTCRAVAILTLLGANSESEFVQYLVGAEPWASDRAGATRVALWSRRLYDGYLWANPLEPDLLGERLVATHVPVAFLSVVFKLPPSRALARALTLISRIAHEDEAWTEAVRPLLVGELSRLAADAVIQERSGSVDDNPLSAALTLALEAIPVGEYAVLAELPQPVGGRCATLAEVLARQLAEWAVEKCAGTGPDSQMAEYLNNWSVRLADIGQLEEALQVAERARAAADDCSLRTTDDVVYCAIVQNLSNRLADTGQSALALDAAELALKGRQAIGGEANEDRLARGRAWMAYGDRLARLGRFSEAVSAGRHSLEDLRVTSGARTGDLATALDNVAIWLARTDDIDEAIDYSQEALAIRRELAAGDRAAFGEALASSLNNAAIWLAGAGRSAEADQLSAEGILLCRDLMDSNPRRIRPVLASALNTSGMRMLELERTDEARTLLEEAVSIRRELYAQVPGAYGPDLAVSLGAMSVCLGRLGLNDGAVEIGEEGLDIRRRLVEAGLGREHVRELAIAHNNMSNRLASAGRSQDAVAHSEAAVGLFKRLVNDEGGGERSGSRDLRSAIVAYANRLAETRQLELSVKTMWEAIDFGRSIQTPTEADNFRLGRALRLQASRLQRLQQTESAIEVALEAAYLLARTQASPSASDELDKASRLLSEMGQEKGIDQDVNPPA